MTCEIHPMIMLLACIGFASLFVSLGILFIALWEKYFK